MARGGPAWQHWIVSVTSGPPITSPPEPGDADVFDFTGRMQGRSIARDTVSLCGASLSDLPRTGSSRPLEPARTWSNGLRVRDWVWECRSRLHSRSECLCFSAHYLKSPSFFFFFCLFCIIAGWFMAFPGVLLVLQIGEKTVSARYGEEVCCWYSYPRMRHF